MLNLYLKQGQIISIGKEIKISVHSIENGQVYLGFAADRETYPINVSRQKLICLDKSNEVNGNRFHNDKNSTNDWNNALFRKDKRFKDHR